MMMRAYARNQEVAITGTRGMTKTYTKLLTEMVNGVVWPGTQVLFTVLSTKRQEKSGSNGTA